MSAATDLPTADLADTLAAGARLIQRAHDGLPLDITPGGYTAGSGRVRIDLASTGWNGAVKLTAERDDAEFTIHGLTDQDLHELAGAAILLLAERQALAIQRAGRRVAA